MYVAGNTVFVCPTVRHHDGRRSNINISGLFNPLLLSDGIKKQRVQWPFWIDNVFVNLRNIVPQCVPLYIKTRAKANAEMTGAMWWSGYPTRLRIRRPCFDPEYGHFHIT